MMTVTGVSLSFPPFSVRVVDASSIQGVHEPGSSTWGSNAMARRKVVPELDEGHLLQP